MIRLAGLLTTTLALLAGCGATAPQPAVTTPTPSPSPVVVPAVSDKINTKLLLADPRLVMQRTEELPLAPGTFAILGDEIVIDDYLEDKFAIYRGGKRITAFDEPVPVVDFAIRDGKWYLLDTDSVVTVYTRTARGLKKVREIQLTDPEFGWKALYFEGANLIADYGDKVLAEGPGPILEDPQITQLDHAMHLTDGNTNAIIPVKYDRQEVERIALTDQHAFYKVTDTAATGTKDDPIKEWMLQFALDGQFVHTYAYPIETSPAEHREFVVADGKLYQMWISSKTVKVFLIEPND